MCSYLELHVVHFIVTIQQEVATLASGFPPCMHAGVDQIFIRKIYVLLLSAIFLNASFIPIGTVMKAFHKIYCI